MCDKQYKPNKVDMEVVINAHHQISQREAETFARVLFDQRIDKALDSLPQECHECFIRIAIGKGYTPIRNRILPVQSANDDSYTKYD